MSFSRAEPTLIAGPSLEAAMRGIGLRVGNKEPQPDADIELTLVSILASALPTDFRMLAVLTTWFDVHYASINVPRLHRFARSGFPTRGSTAKRAFLAATGQWLANRDTRFKSLCRLYDGRRVPLDEPGITSLQIRRRGEDPRFKSTRLRLANGLLRSRDRDVVAPEKLVQSHRGYALRRLMGANYRADVWWALERNPTATVAEIARIASCAYETARVVRRDFEVWSAHRSSDLDRRDL